MANYYDYMAEYQKILEQNAAAKKKAEEAVDTSANAAIEAINQKRPEIEESAANNRRELSANYAASQTALPAQMAKLGLYGQGISETSNIALNNNYKNNLNNVNVQLANANKELDNTIAGYNADAATKKASIVAEYAAKEPELYAQYQQAQREAIANQAATMAQYGDYSLYKDLGYTDAQIALMKKATAKTTTSSGSGSTTKKGDQTITNTTNSKGNINIGTKTANGYSYGTLPTTIVAQQLASGLLKYQYNADGTVTIVPA